MLHKFYLLQSLIHRLAGAIQSILVPSYFPCRWLCQILAYFLFFFNVIFGLVMCILRVFGMLIFTVVMLFRLDWDVYMRGLEGWDTGIWYMYFIVCCV